MWTSPSSRSAKRITVTRMVFVCAAAIPVALCCNTVEGDVTQSSEILPKIVADWNARQQIRGFRYRIAGTEVVRKGKISATYPPGSFTGDIPPEDIRSRLTKEYFVDLERNRSRIETDHGIFDAEFSFVRSFEVDLHDGQKSQRFYPRQRNQARFDDPARGAWAADVEFISDGRPAFGRYGLPVLLAHGMVPVGDRGSTLGPAGTLRRDVTVGEFTVFGRAGREGQPCLVLRSQTDHTGRMPAFREIWVDVEHGSTILRYVRYIADTESFQIDLWYDQDDRRNYSLSRYDILEDNDGRLARTHNMFVLEYELEPMLADSLFHVEPQPGFNVADRVTDRRYRVGLPGEPDRDLAEVFLETQQEQGSSRRALFLGLNIAVALVLGSLLCVVLYYRKKKGGVA